MAFKLPDRDMHLYEQTKDSVCGGSEKVKGKWGKRGILIDLFIDGKGLRTIKGEFKHYTIQYKTI